MRWLLLLLTVVFSLNSAIAQDRKTVAVVLGGGGAKGVAHIGVLKVLEEAGIPIDMVSGTSMGAIVGGLYAIGYSPDEIQQMVRHQNWELLLSDKVKRNRLYFPEKENSERYIVSFPFGRAKKDRIIDGVIKGQNLKNLFSDLTIGYHDAVDFDALLIPYSCVSVDLVTGKDYVFRKGSLPQAMRASMAIPGAITPVRMDSMVLIDGGLNNNYPANVARDMGADIIIGVDLSTSDLKDYDKINSPSDILGQVVALHGFDRYKENVEMTDLLFRPDMEPYKSTSFTAQALDTLIARGEKEARLHWDDIMALKEKIGIKPDSVSGVVQKRKFKHPVTPTDHFYIKSISIDGADPRDEKWLLKISGLKPETKISLNDLRKAMNILVGTNAYSYVNYKLTGENEDNLQLTLQPKSVSSINVGARFDTEEIAAVLLNATYDHRRRNLSKLSFTGRVGAITSLARLDYSIERSPLRNFNLSYQFRYQNLDFYSMGDKSLNTSYSHHFAELAYSDMNWMNFKFKFGLRYQYFDYKNFLYNAESEEYNVRPEGFVSYFINAHLETFDRRYYPTKGVSLRVGYSLYTDNFVKYRGSSPFSAVNLDFSAVIPISSYFSIVPSVAGRVLAGNQLAFPFLNSMGGELTGHYVPQQLSFAGLNHIEIMNNSLAIVGLQLRQRIAGQNYITLTANCALHSNDFFDILQGKSYWGGRLGYAYNSILGPMSASVGLSNRNNHPQFYLNLGYYF